MNEEVFLSSKEAAEFLGYTENTLRVSRTTGRARLGGMATPKHITIGVRVRYRKSDLVEWQKKATKECGG